MEIYLENTLTKNKDTFKPIKSGEVSLYNCGPTVYDYAHIGNLRSYVFADTLRRMFEWNGYTVNQVVNITDIGHLSSDADSGEDKMTKALKREGKPMTLAAMREVADFYFEKFKDDLAVLNIKPPTHFPFASDHIAEDIELIKRLIEKDFTYTTSDGIYFDTTKFPHYGALGQIGLAAEDQSRIGVNSEKKNSRDFALWKFSGKFSDELGYDAEFGKGFPGWHIECSAMSRKYLGQPFDIHTGGIDHIPVHHNNEIAQSEAAYDVPLANYWLHNAHLNMSGEKMAKSGEGFITLQTLRERGINPLALRYFYLTAHYSSPVDFSWEALEAAQTAWKRLKNTLQNFEHNGNSDSDKIERYTEKFITHINDDLDTPKALALMWDIVKDADISEAEKSDLIKKFDKFLGLKLDESDPLMEIPPEVQKLIDERNKARAGKDWTRSDELRAQIEALGFVVKDTENGTQVGLK